MDRYEGQVNGKTIVYTSEGIQFGTAYIPFSQMKDISIIDGATPSWQFTFNGKRMQVPYTEDERNSIEPFLRGAMQQSDLDDMMSSLEVPGEKEPEYSHPSQPEQRYYNDPPLTKTKKPIYKRPWFFIPAALILLFIIIGVAGGGNDDTTASNETLTTTESSTEKSTKATTEAPEETQTEALEETTKAKASESTMTASQRNAYKAAQNYLSFMAFSKAGLIDQLSSEYGDNYARADAEFAVNKLEEDGDVDWNEQAEKAAEQYLDTMSFSKDQLINQLESEYGSKFTHEQAVHGVEAVYDSQ